MISHIVTSRCKAMISWIANPATYDVFQTLFEESFYNCDTPIAIDDGIITNFTYTPLYKGLYKFQIDFAGTSTNISTLVQNDIRPLVFNLETDINKYQLRGLLSLLKILLYRHFDYYVVNITFENNIITPWVFINNYNQQYSELLYVSQIQLDEITQLIKIEDLIGYQPLVDLYNSDAITIDVKASPLIDLLDLKEFDYQLILDVPVVPVGGQQEQLCFAKVTEFTIDPLAQIITNVYDLLQTAFVIDNTPAVRDLVNTYHFTILKQTDTTLYLQHPTLTKSFLLGNIFTYSFTGDWQWIYTANPNTIIQLTYAGMMATKSDDVDVGFDLRVRVPVKSDTDFSSIRDHINDIMNQQLAFVPDDNGFYVAALDKYYSLDNRVLRN